MSDAAIGDVMRVDHTCSIGGGRLTRHDDPITLTHVTKLKNGSVRIVGIRCDGTGIEVVVNPATMTTTDDGATVRIGRAADV